MAVYKIIHIDKGWIVCDGQAELIAFERRFVARRTVHDAEELLHGNEAAKRKPITPRPAKVVATTK